MSVASERERGTWDALLASPLEGREMVWAKLVGVLHGLRWFLAAVILAWTLALLCGALGLGDYGKLVGNALVGGVFMVVIGTWFSLSCATATSHAQTSPRPPASAAPLTRAMSGSRQESIRLSRRTT